MRIDPPLTLRPVRPDDEAFLFRLYSTTRDDLTAAALAADLLESLLRVQFEAREAQYHAMHPKASFDLILAGDLPIGRLVVDRLAHEFVVIDLALLPEARGRGWGTALLGGVIEDAERANRSIRLRVLLGNPARALYERLGFVEIARDEAYSEMQRPVGAGGR